MTVSNRSVKLIPHSSSYLIMTSPVKKSSAIKPKQMKAAEFIASQLRQQIVMGKLKPGDKLHPENVLQTEFEISRPTLREALRILESESLITISRGKYGGARVISIDLNAATRQVGVYLQIKGTTLHDIWLARTVIEPPAAGLLASINSPVAWTELQNNIDAAREAAQNNLLKYADLSAEFSLLITKHCGNQTLHLLASLISDIIRKQHEHVTASTISKSSVHQLRLESIRSREKVLSMMRKGKAVAAEQFWRLHLDHMCDLVLSQYKPSMTIDVLNAPVGSQKLKYKIKK